MDKPLFLKLVTEEGSLFLWTEDPIKFKKDKLLLDAILAGDYLYDIAEFQRCLSDALAKFDGFYEKFYLYAYTSKGVVLHNIGEYTDLILPKQVYNLSMITKEFIRNARPS